MTRPFHYSFLVRDLDEARQFYGALLGCREGRSTESWVDFDFFGNHISVHLSTDPPETRDLGRVDEVTVPMPHFGAVIDWNEFDEIAERVKKANVSFVVTPRVRFAGMPGEQKTMFFRDPSANALEFKAFRDEKQIFQP